MLKKILINSFALLFVSLLASFSLESLSAKDADDRSVLTVRGEAVIQVPADELSLALGVIAQAENAADALAKNSAAMHRVVDALKKEGLSADELRTGQLSLRPIHSRPPKEVPEDWQAKIIGFEATNMVLIATQQLHLAPMFIDAAVRAGANQIQELQFSVKDKQKWRSAVIAQATENAISDAMALTAAAHAKLGRILDLKLDEIPMPSPHHFAMKAMAYTPGNSSPPIEEGTIELRASVTAVYQIQ